MDVKHIAKLAGLHLTAQEEKIFDKQFTDTIKAIGIINELDTDKTPPTYQVTGLTNVFREDNADASCILSQDQALKQAKMTHNGFFIAPSVFDS